MIRRCGCGRWPMEPSISPLHLTTPERKDCSWQLHLPHSLRYSFISSNAFQTPALIVLINIHRPQSACGQFDWITLFVSSMIFMKPSASSFSAAKTELPKA